jgi:hypothetical protein
MMSEKIFSTGQCLCGQVKFTVLSKPVWMGQCHCHHCQKTTGTGHASNAFFKKEDVKIEGKLSDYGSSTDSGSVITRFFCPSCGSRLFAQSNENNGLFGVSAGVFEDNSWFKANAIVYNKRKPEWDKMDENIPAFEEMPPNN